MDVTKAKLVKTLAHDRQLLSSRFSACGQYVFAGSSDQSVIAWTLSTDVKRVIAKHASWVMAIACHPKVPRVFSVDWHGGMQCTQLSTEDVTPVWSIAGKGGSVTRDIAASPDGALLATVGSDANVRLWDSEKGTLLQEWESGGADLYRVAFHPQGKDLITGDLLGKVKQWELSTGKMLREMSAESLHTRGDEFIFIADVGGVRRFAFSPERSLLACGGLAEAAGNTFCNGKQAVVTLDWQTGQQVSRLKVNDAADGPVNGLCFLPEGILAGCGESGAGSTVLCFWRKDESVPFHSIPIPCAYDLDLHPDKQQLALATHAALGQTGNGRLVKNREEYVPNGGAVLVYALNE